ncbi:unnamed protein product [Parnassius apollo]|uniref:(apollo) hypothetical protein n=1 Tax=Parnassius apollo TaxID=110799 RepID=A0A8S3W6U2_PARAO|nr:unnamed protein product [Parnassius apollo]
MSVSKLYERSMKMLQMVIHEDANIENKGVEQAINVESCTDDRFVASQHEPANEVSNLNSRHHQPRFLKIMLRKKKEVDKKENEIPRHGEK